MEIIAILPMTPPAMGPAWPPECEGVEDAVEDALADDADTPDVETPEAPKIAPGPYSGPSISNVGVRPGREAEREDKGGDAHHQLDALRQRPNYFRSGTCYDYGAVEEKVENKP
jgi:hypothetical protein